MVDDAGIRRKLGLSRRDLLRRGAIVGGTLLWTVPTIASITKAHVAAAHTPATACCECTKPKNTAKADIKCPTAHGFSPSEVDTPSQCAHACQELGYTSPNFHTAPGHGSLTCVEGAGCLGVEHPHPSK